ncbi:MAG TPA: hypothetical protein VFA45_05990 [Actinomycetes bacterium]|nr:hypothetical protein [Actinomycetes bacterium]
MEASNPKLYTARAEMVLAHNDVHPLAENIHNEPDPVFRLARINNSLDYDAGERAIIVVDLVPLPPNSRRRKRRKLARRAARMARKEGIPGLGSLSDVSPPRLDHAGDVLFGEGQGNRLFGDGQGSTSRDRKHELNSEEQRVQDALRGRLDSLATGFAIQVLIQVTAVGKDRAERLRDTFSSTFGVFAGANAFHKLGVNLGFVFIGPDVPPLRWLFDLRLRSGLFLPGRRSVVAASEIRPFLRPSWAESEPDNWVFRLAGAQVPPEFQVPQFGYQPDLVPLGRVIARQGVKILATRVSDFRFSFLSGKSKSGKTEQAMNQFIHLARSGYGCFFLDPHPHNINKLRPYLTDVADRIVEIDFSGSGAGREMAWNLLDMQGRTIEDIELKTKAVDDSISSVLHLGLFELHDRTRAYLFMAVHAILELALRLPPELAPTIFQVGTILSDQGWRQATLPYLSPTVRGFWERPFAGGTTEEAIAPITNLLDRFRAWTNAAVLMGAAGSSYDIERLMNEGKIVLACSAGLSEREQLAANFVVYELLYTGLLKRRGKPPSRLRPFYAFIDEIELYDRAGSPYGGKGHGYLADLLERLPRYNVFLAMLNESPERLTPKTVEAILTNRTTMATMALDERSAQVLYKEWSTTGKPLTIPLLDRYQFLASVKADDIVTLPILNHGVPVSELWAHCYDPGGVSAMNQQIEENVRASAGRVARRSIAELNALDDRIRKWLDEHRREVAPPARAPRQAVPASGPNPEQWPQRPQLEVVGGADRPGGERESHKS